MKKDTASANSKLVFWFEAFPLLYNDWLNTDCNTDTTSVKVHFKIYNNYVLM